MNRTRRVLCSALAATCVALALSSMAASAGAVGPFQHETFKQYEAQLNAGQIHDATFNKKAHTLHLTLNDGRRMLVSYPSHEAAQVAAQLRTKGVAVIEKKKKKVTKAVHHTLRYIAGAIVLVVIGVVVAVLLVDRRRRLAATDQRSAGAAAPSTGDPE